MSTVAGPPSQQPIVIGLARWVKCVVVFALLITIMIAIVGPYVLWSYYGRDTGVDAFWFRNGLAIAVGGALVLALVPRLGPSRWLGVTVALPVVHAAAMALAWVGWSRLPPLPDGYRASRLIATSWLIVRGRRGEWGHALVMLALSGLLLLGLWLPIASVVWCAMRDVPPGWQVSRGLVGLVIVPPWLAASAFTAVAVRWPARLPALRARLRGGLAVLCVLAVLCRLGHSEPLLIVFSNFVHVLLALGFLSLVSIAWLALRLARNGHRAMHILADGETLHGEVVPTDDEYVVARVELTSWLRGPRTTLRGFALRTSGGLIPISGGTWASPLATPTMHLATGASQAVLCAGDRVTVAGMIPADGAHPFRGSTRWVAGPGGIWIGVPVRAARRAALDHLVLALWRPCAAYLLILVAVAAPALVAALG